MRLFATRLMTSRMMSPSDRRQSRTTFFKVLCALLRSAFTWVHCTLLWLFQDWHRSSKFERSIKEILRNFLGLCSTNSEIKLSTRGSIFLYKARSP